MASPIVNLTKTTADNILTPGSGSILGGFKTNSFTPVEALTGSVWTLDVGSTITFNGTVIGSSLNTANGLVQTDGSNRYPALNGSLITSLALANLAGLGAGVSNAAALATNSASGLVTRNYADAAYGEATFVDTTQDVYLANRTDGIVGTGTIANPYDVSTQVKFDALMGATGTLSTSPYTIHLGAGTFITATGVTLHSNSRLIGQGIDITTVQRAASTAPDAAKCRVIGGYGGTTGFNNGLVSDLTADGNISNQNTALDLCIEGVSFSGNMLRLKVINCGTTRGGTGQPAGSNMEAFWIFGAGSGSSNPAYNQIIRDCVVVAPVAGYNTFIDASGSTLNADGPVTAATRNAIIDHCTIAPASPTAQCDGHAFSLANVDSATIQNCYVDGIDVGYYQDTWSLRRVKISNNVFTRCGTFGVYFLGPGYAPGVLSSYADTIVIENNLFEMVPATSGNHCGIRFYYGLFSGVSIKNNRIRLSPFTTTTGATNSGVAYHNVTQMSTNIRDNCIDLPFVATRIYNEAYSQLHSGLSVDYENNYDTLGENIVGKKHSRVTFTVPTTGWYTLWFRGAIDYHSMMGRMALRVRNVTTGSATLVGGAATVSMPSITAASNVKLKFVSPGGNPGRHYAVITAGTGFTINSSVPTDTSTVSYVVDAGNEGNAYNFTFSQSAANVAGTLTQIYADNPALSGNGEAAVTSVRTFSDGTSYTTLEGFFTANTQVTEELWTDVDRSLFEVVDSNHLPGSASPGPGGSTVSTLTFNYALGLTSVITTTTSAVVSGRYITNSVSRVTVLLPATASVGDEVVIVGLGAGGWTLTQNASQLVKLNGAASTTGTGGHTDSATANSCVRVMCVIANTTWVVMSHEGSITQA